MRVVSQLVTGLLAAVAVVALTELGSQGLLEAGVAVGLGAAAVLLLVLGTDRVGLLAMVAAFATAPMYKGLAPTPSSNVTAPDLLFVVGFLLLAPRILRARPRLDPPYLLGVGIVTVSTLISASLDPGYAETLLVLCLWITAMFVLPLAIAAWNPRDKVIDLLAWSYVAGQIFDTGWAATHNGAGRWYGLSTHPNYFGQCALYSCALLIFLAGRVSPSRRWVVWGALAINVMGVILSGSRAATVVLAVIIVVVPLLERRAKVVMGLAAIGAVGVVALLYLVPRASDTSSLGRLLGGGSASGSDAQRTEGLTHGWHLFLEHPFGGVGLHAATLFLIHNNYLEVMVSIGIFGLVGYLLVLWSFSRIILTKLPLRRLGYVPLAYIGYGATVPSLYDRSVWSVVALAVLAYQVRGAPEEPPERISEQPADAGRHMKVVT